MTFVFEKSYMYCGVRFTNGKYNRCRAHFEYNHADQPVLAESFHTGRVKIKYENALNYNLSDFYSVLTLKMFTSKEHIRKHIEGLDELIKPDYKQRIVAMHYWMPDGAIPADHVLLVPYLQYQFMSPGSKKLPLTRRIATTTAPFPIVWRFGDADMIEHIFRTTAGYISAYKRFLMKPGVQTERISKVPDAVNTPAIEEDDGINIEMD